MIPDKTKMKDCVGKYATLDHSIVNGAGRAIKKGSKVKIRSFGRCLSIETPPCPCCGQYTIINGVRKSELTLMEE